MKHFIVFFAAVAVLIATSACQRRPEPYGGRVRNPDEQQYGQQPNVEIDVNRPPVKQ